MDRFVGPNRVYPLLCLRQTDPLPLKLPRYSCLYSRGPCGNRYRSLGSGSFCRVGEAAWVGRYWDRAAGVVCRTPGRTCLWVALQRRRPHSDRPGQEAVPPAVRSSPYVLVPVCCSSASPSRRSSFVGNPTPLLSENSISNASPSPQEKEERGPNNSLFHNDT